MGVNVLDGYRNKNTWSYVRSFADRQPTTVFRQDRTARRHRPALLLLLCSQNQFHHLSVQCSMFLMKFKSSFKIEFEIEFFTLQSRVTVDLSKFVNVIPVLNFCFQLEWDLYPVFDDPSWSKTSASDPVAAVWGWRFSIGLALHLIDHKNKTVTANRFSMNSSRSFWDSQRCFSYQMKFHSFRRE